MRDTELFALFARTGDAAFAVDQEGVIRSWNGAAERLLGYPAADVIGRPCADVLQGADGLGAPVCSAGCGVRACACHGPGVAAFDLAVRAASRILWINISTLVWEDERTGRVLFVHLARDASAAKAREALIRSAAAVGRELIELSEPAGDPPVAPLTPQQSLILRLLAEGRSSSDISRELHISPRTLRTHVHHINRKLHARSRLEAVVHGIRRGLIAVPNRRPAAGRRIP